MVLKNYLFSFFILVFSIVFSSDSTLAVDSLVQERTISLNHAKLFSKVLTQDSEGRIKPFHTVSSEILRKISRLKSTS